MSYQSIPLLAGRPHRLDIAGRLILIDSVSESGGVDVEILLAGSSKTTTVPRRKAGFRLVQAYDGVILTSAVDATVGIFLSNDDVQLGVADGAAVSLPGGVNITNIEPIPVLFGGTVEPVLGTVDITGDVAVVARGANTVTNTAPVAATDIESALLAANPARRGVRINNAGPGAVAIGGAGLVYDHAAITIRAGETWNEADAPGAAWWVICEPGETASIKIQEIS